uniref:Uncharacterized protein n=1 Tax=Anguilla anguilla TaxID=7936 RepID=A0A0E9TRL3_ANGAN
MSGLHTHSLWKILLNRWGLPNFKAVLCLTYLASFMYLKVTYQSLGQTMIRQSKTSGW